MSKKLLKSHEIVPDEPLSYLTQYKSNIDEISITEITEEFVDELEGVLKQLNKPGFFTYYLNQDLKEKARKKVDRIQKSLEELDILLDEFKDSTDKFLRQEEHAYLSKSYQLYDEQRKMDTPEYILDRTLFKALIYRDEIDTAFIDAINKHSDWKYPGMFIRPEYGKYVQHMVDSDPLYIVDEIRELISPVREGDVFTKELNARLRYSFINDDDAEIFKKIPKEQLGLVVAMNFFNHKPIDIIRKYASEIFNLLRDGGCFLFTYNNCDHAIAVKNFEKSLYTYTPGSLLIPMLEMIGFKVLSTFDEPLTNVSWLELQKPGKLHSLRGGQSLAQIIDKNNLTD